MQNRLLSLDVFRGITVMAMILVNNPGDWGHVYAPLLHAHWHGCTPTDLIFPFFLFIVGVSISYALDKAKTQPQNHGAVIQKVIKRGLTLVALGLFLSLYPKFEFATMRIPGVLQRIGLVFIICSVIFLKTNLKTQVFIGLFLLVAYYVLMSFVPVPGIGPANLEPETNLGAWIDNSLLNGHLYKRTKVWDPEGLFSTIPAVATGLLGILAGSLLKSGQSPTAIIRKMCGIGLLCALAGLALHGVFPINKSLWTSTYVLFAGGLAMLGLALCYWSIDIKQWRFWTPPFLYFGVNAIIVFFLSGIIPRTLFLIQIQDGAETLNAQQWLYKHFFTAWIPDPYVASLAGAVCFLVIWFFILRQMYRANIIVKV